MKPILFNTRMVRSILNDEKNQTRRIAKSLYNPFSGQYGETLFEKPKYKRGDILYVRETWREVLGEEGNCVGYEYKADELFVASFPVKQRVKDPATRRAWKPSIHMPQKAARLFLLVEDVWLERLQDISQEDLEAEGFLHKRYLQGDGALLDFQAVWDTTLPPKSEEKDSWDANPWVRVTKFSRWENVKEKAI